MAVVKVYLDVSMGLGIPGLTKLLEESGIAVHHAPVDTMWMFLNRNRTQIKILWGGVYMLHLRKSSDPWSIEELKRIPSFFKQSLLSGKIENQLTKYISKRVNVTVDESGIKVG
jgi:hypothetical protein